MSSRKVWAWAGVSSAREDVAKMTQRGPPWRHGRVVEEVESSWVAIVLRVFVVWACVSESVVAVNSDGEALLAFKAVLQDPTGILNAWKASDPDPCLWDGVTCNTNLKVQRLLLENTQLSGPISGPALRNLTDLRTLVLSQNNFSGALPPELSQIGTHAPHSSTLSPMITILDMCWVREWIVVMVDVMVYVCVSVHSDVVEAQCERQ